MLTVNKRKRIILWFCILACVAGFAVLLFVRSPQEDTKPVRTIQSPQEYDAGRWLTAVESGDPGTAVETAARLCKDVDLSREPDELYAKLAAANGIAPQFLRAEFNERDFQSWKHALFFKKLADKIVKENASVGEVRALFLAVAERLESTDPPKGNILWPFNIWSLEKGLCDRQAWVLCELAYQRGYEAQIVYLRHPETMVSPHTICEIRKDGRVWVADPFSEVLLPDTSCADFRRNASLAGETWPDRRDWHEAIKNVKYWTPAYPQDYCERNRRLHDFLQQSLGKDVCPRFGESPAERLKSYHAMFSDDEKEQKLPIDLWFYPFRLLNAEFRGL